MKLKFRADSKDVVYFSIFCVFLLYIIALAVLNLSSFSSTGSFYGLNPIEAFSSKYLIYTLVLFLVAFFGIIAVVSSYFFDREKGFGVSADGKKEDGYERWAKDKEMMNAQGIKKVHAPDPTFDAAGVPLYSKNDDIYVDDGEAHSLIIGATGSGKTACMVNPLVNILAKKGESMIITDPKGEIYENNAGLLRDRGYNVIILNFRDPQKGNAWNPLTLPYQLFKSGNSDKSNELLRDLAINILHEEKTDDPFWQNSAADFFTGMAQGLFQDAKEEEINLNSIILMLTTGEEKYGNSNYMKEYFLTKEASNPAYINAAGTINAPNETKGSVISVFRQKVTIFAMAENLSEMLSHSDFNMMDIGKQKTAVFLVIQDEKKTYHALATIFVKQCYESLIDVAHHNGGKLNIRTNFILDEFANMPPLKDVTTMITAARSRQIRFNLIIQNFAQLNQVYGKENAETIKGNCGNTIYLLSSELNALEEISKLVGDKKVKSKDKDKKDEVRPLITVAELQRLKFKDAIIKRLRLYPFKTKLRFVSEYNWNNPQYEKGTYVERKKKPIQYFDLREFVKEKKRSKLFEVLDDPMNMKPPMNTYEPPRRDFGGPPTNNMFDDSFNVDDLIKKIDAKIAELEAEEKNNKPASITPIAPESNPIVNNKNIDESLQNFKEKVEENKPIEKQEVVVNPNLDKIVDSASTDTTDDQFFDDFFFDE